MAFLDDLDEPAAELVPAPPAEPARRRNSQERQLDRLRAREDRILEKSLAVIEDIGHARDIDDGDEEIPEEWIAELGLVEARRRHRVATDARKNPRDQPVYLGLMKSVAVGIVKARAAQPRAEVSLNFTFTLPGPAEALPIIDIEPDEK